MALAAEIPAEYKPTIEWTDIGGVIHKYTLTVNVYYEGKYVGKVSSSDNNLSAKCSFNNGSTEIRSDRTRLCIF